MTPTSSMPLIDQAQRHADEMAELLSKCLSAIQYQPASKRFRDKIAQVLARHEEMVSKKSTKGEGR